MMASLVVITMTIALTGCNQPVSSDVAATVNGRPVTYTSLTQTILAEDPNSQLRANADQAVAGRLAVAPTVAARPG